MQYVAGAGAAQIAKAQCNQSGRQPVMAGAAFLTGVTQPDQLVADAVRGALGDFQAFGQLLQGNAVGFAGQGLEYPQRAFDQAACHLSFL